MQRTLIYTFLWLIAVASVSAGTEDKKMLSTEVELRKKTQELLDAIAPGDRSVWRSYVHERMLHVDENGLVRNKEELLRELKPLPAGLKGTIEVASFDVQIHGNVAVSTHEDQEHLDYHGQQLASRFRATDTWLKTKQGWRLIASQIIAVQKDPPAVRLTQAQLCAYNGTFALTQDITEKIHCRQEDIATIRTGRPEVIYKSETADVFFAPGQPRTRRIFQRDNTGAVTGFVDRREGEDVIWRRVR